MCLGNGLLVEVGREVARRGTSFCMLTRWRENASEDDDIPAGILRLLPTDWPYGSQLQALKIGIAILAELI